MTFQIFLKEPALVVPIYINREEDDFPDLIFVTFAR